MKTGTLLERLAGIELLVLDVDGVLTDGRIVYDDAGGEIRFFHVRDGSILKLWTGLGKRASIISGRRSGIVERRALELDLAPVYQGYPDKLPALRLLIAETGVHPSRICAFGDDLPDLPVLRNVGVGIAVADACEELRSHADYVTTNPGGRGAVREVVEMILKAQGLFQTRLAGWMSEEL